MEQQIRRRAVELKTRAEIEAMKKAGQMAGLTLAEVGKYIQQNITTEDLDQIANKFIKKLGGKPTFLGYRGYPATLCISINEEVVHGIPSKRKIKVGDIVSVDFATTVDGFVGDTAKSWLVEPVTNEARKLVGITERSLEKGIDAMKPGNRLGDVGYAVQSFVEPYGYGIVRDFVGHGIGREMHEEPAVPNYGTAGTGLKLEPGLVLALEPMVTEGSFDVRLLEDGWTVVTKDKSLAAHFEHTVAITEDGPVVLTKVEK